MDGQKKVGFRLSKADVGQIKTEVGHFQEDLLTTMSPIKKRDQNNPNTRRQISKKELKR